MKTTHKSDSKIIQIHNQVQVDMPVRKPCRVHSMSSVTFL